MAVFSFSKYYFFKYLELYKLVAKRVPGKSATSFVMKEEKVVVVASSKAASKGKASTSSSSKRRRKNDDDDDDDMEVDTG